MSIWRADLVGRIRRRALAVKPFTRVSLVEAEKVVEKSFLGLAYRLVGMPVDFSLLEVGQRRSTYTIRGQRPLQSIRSATRLAV